MIPDLCNKLPGKSVWLPADKDLIIDILRKKDLKTYGLEQRIKELESKFAKDFSQNTFDEIKKLKKEQNIN